MTTYPTSRGYITKHGYRRVRAPGERRLRSGQRVRIHKRSASVMPHHGKLGVVRTVSRGPGPRNVGVEIDGRTVVIPRGNLVAVGEKAR